VTTLFIADSVFQNHLVPEGHPERPARLAAIEKALAAPVFAPLTRENAPAGNMHLATLAHPAGYVGEIVAQAPAEGLHFLDADTSMSPGTLPAAFAALGAAERAVSAIIDGEVANAFIACRPPGHHAEREAAMGFCFFNNIAVAARLAQARGAKRIVIVDWDVHHGNGTQDIFWSDRDVLFISSHEMPNYPGTGAMDERGEHDNILNLPLRAGDGGRIFREAFETRAFPAIRKHGADMILISAGFDAHRRDPLAEIRLEAADFAWATEKLMGLAQSLCGNRILSMLEGGYDLEGLAESTAAHVEMLMGA